MDGVQEVIYNKVIDCLENKKMFLDPDLSLIKFSKIVGTNTTYLSNTINQHFNCNFRTLVNQYRIRFAQRALKDGTLTLNSIPMGTGFTSKSSFYDWFLRVTGTTPGAFVRQNNIDK